MYDSFGWFESTICEGGGSVPGSGGVDEGSSEGSEGGMGGKEEEDGDREGRKDHQRTQHIFLYSNNGNNRIQQRQQECWLGFAGKPSTPLSKSRSSRG